MNTVESISQKAEELAELIGPISTKKDRIRIIKNWVIKMLNDHNKELNE